MSLAYLGELFAQLALPAAEYGRWASPAVPSAARAAVLAAEHERGARPMVIVAARQDSADRLVAALAAFLPSASEPLIWSAPDPLPYEQLPHDADLSARRIATLDRLGRAADGCAPIVVTTVRGLISLVRSPTSLARFTIELRVGGRQDDRRLVEQLVQAGYRFEPVVESIGTLSRRGGIIDVFSPGMLDALRIEFFGDEIESIRRFDPVSQRSIERIDAARLLPPVEFDLSESAAGLEQLSRLDLSTLRPEVHDEWIELLERLRAGAIPEAVDLLAPAFPDNQASLLDYLPPDTLLVELDPDAIALEAEQIELRAEEVRRTLEDASELPADLPRPHCRWSEIESGLTEFARWRIGTADTDGWEQLRTGRDFSEPPIYGGRIETLVEDTRERLHGGWRIVIASDQSERVRDLLADHGIYPRVTKRGSMAADDPPRPGMIDVVHAPIEAGFALNGPRLLVLSDRELFGIHKTLRPPARPRPRPARLLRQLEPASYVVHVEHGVGIYQGLTALNTSGIQREYLQVNYADGDKLYVPVDQSDRITPYEAPGGTPRITKLSSAEWTRTKSRVRAAVREMAHELLQIYASRELASGHAFPPDAVWDTELEESFPYRETPDQLRAIDDVKGDLETDRPMDRLVCGDVGYGKTEVALRAAFKAVNAGWQVAILVPTTVLALQHFETFKDRLAAFPVTVEMLSRLRSKTEQRRILDALAEGTVDIVIGTHRLLQKDVGYKRLGLLVVDEEQRFGVRHKEQVKQLRAEIDVLTMTATPIPRTLYMALTGVRDLSLISTPPQERVPIRTFVTAHDESVVREAILREMSRGGQVFFVHNRVQSIYNVAGWLQELVPEARLNIGHGQMDEEELEQVVLSFIRHDSDVLVCTTIIESGVDIPNANTIVIDNAHALGLTQLYQLRGRVGRGANRAYAYLLYPPHTPLSPEARARLAAIQEATDLGAGFQIAMRDLEIRGAGNILGAQQSGHIAAVGLDLYTRMLSHAVEELRSGKPIVEPEDVNLDIAVDARIPDEYIADEAVRLEIYRKIAGAENHKELRDLRAELVDRFGSPPQEVQSIFDLVRLRHRARELGITTIVEREGEIYLRPVTGAALDQNGLRRLLGQGVRVTPNQVRLILDDLRVDRWTAVTAIMEIFEETRNRLLVG
jgi:transcription-repair coupling factor (superfamily II helicase)